MKNAIINLTLLAIISVFVSCSSDLLKEDPPNFLVAENLFTSKSGFDAAINGLYHEVRKERMGSTGPSALSDAQFPENSAGDLRLSLMINGTDNIFPVNPSNADRTSSLVGTFNNPSNDYIRRIFGWLYRTVNGANTIVDRAENPDIDWTEEEKNEVVAQARLIRAWAYRHLTYLWGDVPLNLTESLGTNIRTDWVRTPVDEVLEAMEDDLLFAEENLPLEPLGEGRVSKAVAQHYLAELYLRMDRPLEAETKAQAAIDGPFSLITQRYGVRSEQDGVPFMDQFYDGNVLRYQGNTEALWTILQEEGIDNTDQGKNIMRRYFISLYRLIPGIELSADRGGRGIARLSMTNWALSIYEPEDHRGGGFAITDGYTYTESNGDNPPSGSSFGDVVSTIITPENSINNNNRRFYPHIRKWEDGASANQTLINQPYLRLAETYLLLAEARLDNSNPQGAADAINVLRSRANASLITAADVDIDFILDERSRELLSEEHRRYTLLRTGKLIERVRNFNPRTAPFITERELRFPIPQIVIDANITSEMRQNDGY